MWGGGKMKRFLLAISLFGLSSAAVAQVGQTVVNQTLGLEVTKPNDWQHLTAEANAENLRRLHTDDPEFQQAIAKYASAPVIAFTKYAEPYPDLNPSFKINVRPMGQFAGRSATEILSLIVPSLARTFPDMKVEQPPQPTTVAGQPAAYVKIAYTLVAGESRFPTTSEMWIVPKGSFFLMIGAGTRQDEANGTRAEIQSILSTLKFEPGS